MRRILFHVGRVPIYSYPAMLYVGLVTGVFTGVWAARQLGLRSDPFVIATLLLIGPALIGARLWFVFGHWEIFRRQTNRIFRRGDGGAAMYGGLFVAVPLSVPVLRLLDLPFGGFWDASAFTILVGMTITRVGCLLNGCCSGRVTSSSFGVNLPDAAGIWRRRVPTQLLEMGFGLVLLTGEIVGLGRAPFPGAIILSIVAAYGLGRIVLEGLREDATGGRTRRANQLTSGALALASCLGLVLGWM